MNISTTISEGDQDVDYDSLTGIERLCDDDSLSHEEACWLNGFIMYDSESEEL